MACLRWWTSLSGNGSEYYWGGAFAGKMTLVHAALMGYRHAGLLDSLLARWHQSEAERDYAVIAETDATIEIDEANLYRQAMESTSSIPDERTRRMLMQIIAVAQMRRRRQMRRKDDAEKSEDVERIDAEVVDSKLIASLPKTISDEETAQTYSEIMENMRSQSAKKRISALAKLTTLVVNDALPLKERDNAVRELLRLAEEDNIYRVRGGALLDLRWLLMEGKLRQHEIAGHFIPAVKRYIEQDNYLASPALLVASDILTDKNLRAILGSEDEVNAFIREIVARAKDTRIDAIHLNAVRGVAYEAVAKLLQHGLIDVEDEAMPEITQSLLFTAKMPGGVGKKETVKLAQEIVLRRLPKYRKERFYAANPTPDERLWNSLSALVWVTGYENPRFANEAIDAIGKIMPKMSKAMRIAYVAVDSVFEAIQYATRRRNAYAR